jgi:hypothetical protein
MATKSHEKVQKKPSCGFFLNKRYKSDRRSSFFIQGVQFQVRAPLLERKTAAHASCTETTAISGKERTPISIAVSGRH